MRLLSLGDGRDVYIPGCRVPIQSNGYGHVQDPDSESEWLTL